MRRLARHRPGGWGHAGGRDGGKDAPDIDFNRILARLIRYFHQPKEYWLEKSTFQDWTDIYGRELNEAPPTEAFAAGYFKYEPSGTSSEAKEVTSEMPSLADL